MTVIEIHDETEIEVYQAAIEEERGPLSEEDVQGLYCNYCDPRNLYYHATVDGEPAAFFFLAYKGDHIGQVHSLVRKKFRRLSFRIARESLRHCFTHHPVSLITSFCPYSNKPAKIFALRNGFKVTASTNTGEIVALNVFEWIDQEVNRYPEYWAPFGKKFHDQLEKVNGSLSHEDDIHHDAAVGLALKIPSPKKAIAVYNYWAAQHDYAHAEYLGETSEGEHEINIHTNLIRISYPGNILCLPLQQ